MNDLEKALTGPCPGCKMPADSGCVDIETGAAVTGVHQVRIYRAYVVDEADAHNRAIELEDRLADLDAIARAAIHYVNCPQSEAETGEPYDALVHAVRVHERKEQQTS